MTKKFKYFCLCAIIALAILFSLFSPILEGMTAPNEGIVADYGYVDTASLAGEYGGATNFAAIDDAAKTTEVIELSWWESFMAWLADIFPFLFI
jgi:hypothetical protein